MTASSYTPPFLKWAGGKRWLAQRHRDLFPAHFQTYFEPFLGGGAVFFSLRPSSAVLSDINGELVNLYQSIQKDWVGVYSALMEHARNHNKEYYYKIRMEKPVESTGKAAWFLYMNRACYNGLYRVNLRGVFNVPKGTKEKIIMDDDDFESSSIALKGVEIIECDFEKTIERAGTGDLIYVDPPYTVRHNTNGFLKYNENIFSWADQERLASALAKAEKRGARAIVSNADHDCLRTLYKDVGEILAIKRHSVIGGGANYRSSTSEIVVKIGF